MRPEQDTPIGPKEPKRPWWRRHSKAIGVNGGLLLLCLLSWHWFFGQLPWREAPEIPGNLLAAALPRDISGIHFQRTDNGARFQLPDPQSHRGQVVTTEALDGMMAMARLLGVLVQASQTEPSDQWQQWGEIQMQSREQTEPVQIQVYLVAENRVGLQFEGKHYWLGETASREISYFLERRE